MLGFEEYGFFLLKMVSVIAAILIVWFGLVAISSRAKRALRRGHLEIRALDQAFRQQKSIVEAHIFDKKELKTRQKQVKKNQKSKKKQKNTNAAKHKIFVLDFAGDMSASGVSALRREVDAILQVANSKKDEVLIKLESPGGTVVGYGLAASQLDRLRQAGLKLTASVDKVAASGGYMMACVANEIIAAPFAIIGSIGVIFQLPNFHTLLSKHGIEMEQVKAGEFKRTLTVFGKNTNDARDKVQDEVDGTHDLFKQFVSKHRSVVDIEQVATGQYWYAEQAFDMHLVDQLQTSDDYLLAKHRDKSCELFQIKWHTRQSLKKRFSQAAKAMLLGV